MFQLLCQNNEKNAKFAIENNPGILTHEGNRMDTGKIIIHFTSNMTKKHDHI